MSAHNEEQFVFVLAVVPYKRATHLCDLYILIADLRDTFRRPVFGHVDERGFEFEWLGGRTDGWTYLSPCLNDGCRKQSPHREIEDAQLVRFP